MTTTLAQAIDATAEIVDLAGYVSGAETGATYRIEDELITLQSFGVKAIDAATYPDPTRWNVRRGQHGTARAPHASGSAVTRATMAFVAGSSLADPAPFTGGGVALTDGTTTVDPASTVTTPPGGVADSGLLRMQPVIPTGEGTVVMPTFVGSVDPTTVPALAPLVVPGVIWMDTTYGPPYVEWQFVEGGLG
jgi:hypothetical protein